MPHILANEISLFYRRIAAATPSAKRPLILIRGLGSQSVEWPEGFIDFFAASRDVIVFDNRDVGQSQRFDVAGVPDLHALGQSLKAGMAFPLPYTMHDMAADVVGLMDALEIERADIMGMSLGGIVAQHLAVDHAARMGGVVCVMSLAGDRSLPAPQASDLAAPDVDDRDALIDYLIADYQTHQGQRYPSPPEALRERAIAAVENGYSPQGIARQMAAAAADDDRSARLATITTPFMVVHGLDDKLILPVCGEDIANKVPGAVYLPVAGMGHDVGGGLEAVIGPPIVAFLDAATA